MEGFESLLQRIENRQAVVGMVGLGFVGLPLALAKAQAGYRVIGFDVDAEKVKKVNDSNSYIEDVSTEELKKEVEGGRFTATTDFSQVGQLDAISICVPTPIDQYKSPELAYLIRAATSIAEHLPKALLIILSSTTYPGTTEEVVKPIFEARGRTVGKDVFLAYSPERIDPGNKSFQIKKIPRVVGGITVTCTRLAASLYEKVLQERLIEVDSPAIAEMAKIMENTFRLVNIGLINELAVLCYRMGLDIWKVIEAASTKPYGFLPFYPGPGIGGHCIPVDPYYLTWKAKEYHFSPQLIEKAGEINESMPHFVVFRTMLILNQFAKAMQDAKVLIIGVAYKKNVADLRESPVLEIVKLLAGYGVDWCYHDPHIAEWTVQDQTRSSVSLTPEKIAEQDLILIATDHDAIDYSLLAEHARAIFDTRNVMGQMQTQGTYFKL